MSDGVAGKRQIAGKVAESALGAVEVGAAKNPVDFEGMRRLERPKHRLICCAHNFEVGHSVATASHRCNPEGLAEEARRFRPDLRHVERQRDPPRQPTVANAMDGDIEASLTVDETCDVVTYIGRARVQPG